MDTLCSHSRNLGVIRNLFIRSEKVSQHSTVIVCFLYTHPYRFVILLYTLPNAMQSLKLKLAKVAVNFTWTANRLKFFFFVKNKSSKKVFKQLFLFNKYLPQILCQGFYIYCLNLQSFCFSLTKLESFRYEITSTSILVPYQYPTLNTLYFGVWSCLLASIFIFWITGFQSGYHGFIWGNLFIHDKKKKRKKTFISRSYLTKQQCNIAWV